MSLPRTHLPLAPSTPPYPLLLRPELFEKVWGGRRLESLGKALPPGDARFGESWELADMSATSAGGAGGGAVHSLITNGALAGKTIRDAAALWRTALIASPAPAFPLLIKFLDAAENLSVQVHPSPALAARTPGANLKTECWYILAADPGAMIYKGIRPGVSRAEFERLARSGLDKIVDALIALPAVPGQMHNLPSGTVHALGAGVLVAEVQTPSDTTYRLYDWGRRGRALHIDESLASASFPGEPGHDELVRGMSVAALSPGELCARLVTTPFFTVDELRPLSGDEVTIGYTCSKSPASGGCFALMVIAGDARIESRAGSHFDPLPVRAGDTALIPAAIARDTILRAGNGLRILRIAATA